MRRYLFAVVLGLGGAALLASLGFWQLQRLAWKEGILAQIEARIAAEPVALPEAPERERDLYLPVLVTGEVGARELHVLVSARDLGAGFRIVTAFEMPGGRRILLDLGFVPDEAKDAARAPAALSVTGNLHWPDDRDRFTPANDPAANFWFARDVEQMAQVLATEPTLIVARSMEPAPPGVLPLPVGVSGIPNNHLGYAVQWFGLAAVWLGMTAYLIRRISRPGKKRQDDA